jgi:hypothetical protein
LFILEDFFGAYGVLNFLKNTLRVLLIAVTLERLDFVHLRP